MAKIWDVLAPKIRRKTLSCVIMARLWLKINDKVFRGGNCTTGRMLQESWWNKCNM
ncbi:hypothetical protein Hanom_Chr10g00956321 [Helianthus anomalus]